MLGLIGNANLLSTIPVRLSAGERRELKMRARSRALRAEDVRRAQLILLLAQGEPYSVIEERLGCNAQYISCWKKRFLEDRLGGLYSRHQGRTTKVLTPALEARILKRTYERPKDGSAQWSTRKLGAFLGISHMMVARVWARAGLQPHRLQYYMVSNDGKYS